MATSNKPAISKPKWKKLDNANCRMLSYKNGAGEMMTLDVNRLC